MASKSQLAVFLSHLEKFDAPKLMEEQYSTDSESAATALWHAFMKGDIQDKIVADFGCGTGILGIGCLVLGAKKVYFIDKDPEAIKITEKNLEQLDDETQGKSQIVLQDIKETSIKADIVVENPPFGTKTGHADREFLMKAFSSAPIIYSFHKANTQGFVEEITKDNRFEIKEVMNFKLILGKTQTFHTKAVHRIDVNCYRLEKREDRNKV